MWEKKHKTHCCVSTAAMVRRTRHSGTLYAHCLSCTRNTFYTSEPSSCAHQLQHVTAPFPSTKCLSDWPSTMDSSALWHEWLHIASDVASFVPVYLLSSWLKTMADPQGSVVSQRTAIKLRFLFCWFCMMPSMTQAIQASGVPKGGVSNIPPPPPKFRSFDKAEPNFLLYFTLFSYCCNLLNKGFF
jgi:hypothetical protein